MDSTSAPVRRGGRRKVERPRSMLRKLLGRLSQKINPHAAQDTFRPPTNHVKVPCSHGRRHHYTIVNTDTAGFSSTRVDGGVATSMQLAVSCSHHRSVDPRTTSLSIRSSLQSCATLANSDCTNNNCSDKPARASNDVSWIQYRPLGVGRGERGPALGPSA